MPIKIHVVTNEHFNANTYVIESNFNHKACYLIDIGNYDGVMSVLKKNQNIKGVFLTHAHIDHIFGVNEIVDQFPDCIIYCSKYTEEALKNAKLNLSFYHKNPIIYQGDAIEIINENSIINLYDTIELSVLETPGHNQGSLTFKIDQAIFTGDSLIPETAVVTKLKSGNKVDAQKSIAKIKNNCNPQDIIYPGHGRFFETAKVNWDFYL